MCGQWSTWRTNNGERVAQLSRSDFEREIDNNADGSARGRWRVLRVEERICVGAEASAREADHRSLRIAAGRRLRRAGFVLRPPLSLPLVDDAGPRAQMRLGVHEPQFVECALARAHASRAREKARVAQTAVDGGDAVWLLGVQVLLPADARVLHHCQVIPDACEKAAAAVESSQLLYY